MAFRNLLAQSNWGSEQTLTGDYPITWNEILAGLGPLLLDEATRHNLGERFDRVFRKSIEEQVNSDAAEYVDHNFDAQQDFGGETPRYRTAVSVDPEGFETALIQMQALGLVIPGVKKRGVSDHASYWTLSPWGKTSLLQLRSVRSGSTKPPSEDDQNQEWPLTDDGADD